MVERMVQFRAAGYADRYACMDALQTRVIFLRLCRVREYWSMRGEP